MNIYQENGYIDFDAIHQFMNEKNIPYCFIVGQRGTGKSTSGMIHLIDQKEPFILFRLSVKEIKMNLNPEYNCFNEINEIKNRNIYFKKIPNVDNDLFIMSDSEQIGMATALDTFGHNRGVSMQKYTLAFLDEFIPEDTIRKTKGEGLALKQSFETINRNRELQGRKSLKMICCANANNLNNEILLDFNLIPMFEFTTKKGYDYMVRDKILLINTQNSPISKLKAETDLYKSGAAQGSFRDMALYNRFSRHYSGNVDTVSLNKQFEMKFIYKNLLFLRGPDFWYVTEPVDIVINKVKGNIDKIEMYGDSNYEEVRIRRAYYFLTELYYNEHIKFERSDLELRFINLFRLDKK